MAREQYALQGWKKGKIYPDFIFAVQRGGKTSRVVVLETKGDHLDNLDTGYKRRVMDLMSRNFAWDEAVPAGTLQLVKGGETVECALVLMSDWPTRLPGMLA